MTLRETFYLRKLARALLISTALIPILLNGQTVDYRANACLMKFSSDEVGQTGDENQQAMEILAGAYANSVMHDSANADLEANDLLLETASIEFASRLVAITDPHGLPAGRRTGRPKCRS